MNNDNVGRIALLCIMGVIGAVAISKPELQGQEGLNEGIVRWLLYVIACGLVVNSQEGKPLGIISLAAASSAFALVCTIAFKMFMVGGVPLSGVTIGFEDNAVFAVQLLGGLLLLSTFAITIAALSRGIVLSLLDNLFNVELSKAKHIEAILNRVVSIGAIGAVIVFSIL